MRWCVYKHTNKANGKAYVGRCRWPNYHDRWANGNGYKNAPVFWPAIVETGWDGFSHEILASDLSLEESNRIEMQMIAKFRTDDPAFGYNVSHGGAASFKGLHHTDDAKRRIAERLKAYEMTEEHRRHLSESKFGIKHPRAKKVWQLTKDGRFIKEWGCMMDACRALGIQKANVSACCRGKVPSAGGYKWEFGRS